MTAVRKVGGLVLAMAKDPAFVRKVGGFALIVEPQLVPMTSDGLTMLRSLINEVSTVAWTSQTLSISSARSEEVGDTNTAITVAPLGDAPFSGDYTLRYNRVEFLRLFIGRILSTPLTPVNDLADALSQVNQRYGVYLTEADVEPQTLSGQTQVTLIAAGTSYILSPGTQITIGS